MVWSLNAKLAVFSGKQSTEGRGGLQWKGNLLNFIIRNSLGGVQWIIYLCEVVFRGKLFYKRQEVAFSEFLTFVPVKRLLLLKKSMCFYLF